MTAPKRLCIRLSVLYPLTTIAPTGAHEHVRRVISASRRTDIPMRFTAWLAQAIQQEFVDVPQPYNGRVRRVSLLPQDVHTVVLWSKDFGPLLHDADGVRRALKRYDQMYCHLTVTGLGGSPLEPLIPPWQEVVGQLPRLVQFAGDPLRVSVRFDPIVHWHEGGAVRSNLSLAEPILHEVSRSGVTSVRISFATLYGKVRKRRGWQWYDPPLAQRLEAAQTLAELARALGLTLYGCSQIDLAQAGVPASHCVDGELLSTLHPHGLPAPSGKDPGQRQECGCTPSVDIGAYSMRCPNSCAYCYANPL